MAVVRAQLAPGKKTKRSWEQVPYLLPAFLFISALTLIPAAYTIYLSFTNASLIYPESRFIGLGNYQFFFCNFFYDTL